MHIPENYLSPVSCAVMTAAMVPVWVHAVKKVKKDIPKKKMPMLGVGAAFSFIGMMFNVPMVGGTTGHAVGGTLIALLLGPEAACISVTIALLIQAVFFGDGGILAFGANCFNMAFALPFVGYGVCKLITKHVSGEKGKNIGAAVGSYIGINVAALLCAIEFGVQPYLFKDSLGQALYCPYGLNVSIPSMMIAHLTVFGAVELIFTVSIYAFVRKLSPETIENRNTSVGKPVYILLAALMALVPIGLLATGTAWGEWGVDEMESLVGYTPSGMASGFELTTLFPDYSIGNLPETVGYYLSAIIGVAMLVLIFKVIASMMKEKTDFDRA